jgi:hypothetical protein
VGVGTFGTSGTTGTTKVRAGNFSQLKSFLPGAQIWELLLSNCEHRDFPLASQLRFGLGNRRGADMKKTLGKRQEEILMKSPNCVAIMGILAEMARRLNENIAKVDLKPLQVLGSRGIIESAKP